MTFQSLYEGSMSQSTIVPPAAGHPNSYSMHHRMRIDNGGQSDRSYMESNSGSTPVQMRITMVLARKVLSMFFSKVGLRLSPQVQGTSSLLSAFVARQPRFLYAFNKYLLKY